MHDAERAIAGLDVLQHHAETVDVGQLLEADRLALHLGPDRKRLLAPPGDLRGQSVSQQVLGELAFDLTDQVSVALGQRIQPLLHDAIGFRIERVERKILELFAHLVHAHAAGERRIDVERLLGNPLPRGRRHEFQRAHVVQTVGKLDQEHANVVGDRQQQFAQVLGLLGFARHQLQPLQLGESLHQRADLGAEDVVDFGACRLGVLDGVVQQRRHDGGVIELEVGEDRRDLERMREIGVAGGAGLGAVRLHGVDIGAVQKVFIGIRVVRPDALNQVVLPHHPRTRRLGRLHRRRHGGRHRDRFGRGLHLGCAAAPIRHQILALPSWAALGGRARHRRVNLVSLAPSSTLSGPRNAHFRTSRGPV